MLQYKGVQNMNDKQKEFRAQLVQENFDYFIWNGKNINEVDLIARLYRVDFNKSEAQKAVTFIYNQTSKALRGLKYAK